MLPRWLIGALLGLVLVALPLKLDWIVACAVIAAYAMVLAFRVRELPPLLSSSPEGS